MIVERLYKKFDHIVIYDAEFEQDIMEKAELPRVVCFVYLDIKTGKTHYAYGDNLKTHPYPLNKTLFVSYNIVAEASAMFACGMELPKYIFDCYVENRKLYYGRIPKVKGAFGLLRTAARYKVPNLMSVSLKDYYHRLVIDNKTYTNKH